MLLVTLFDAISNNSILSKLVVRIVFATSSRAIYANAKGGVITGKTEVLPNMPYGWVKIEHEDLRGKIYLHHAFTL